MLYENTFKIRLGRLPLEMLDLNRSAGFVLIIVYYIYQLYKCVYVYSVHTRVFAFVAFRI